MGMPSPPKETRVAMRIIVNIVALVRGKPRAFKAKVKTAVKTSVVPSLLKAAPRGNVTPYTGSGIFIFFPTRMYTGRGARLLQVVAAVAMNRNDFTNSRHGLPRRISATESK